MDYTCPVCSEIWSYPVTSDPCRSADDTNELICPACEVVEGSSLELERQDDALQDEFEMMDQDDREDWDERDTTRRRFGDS